MNLKTLVKVGNISNLSDARYCAGMGVQMLGFNIDPQDPGHISLQTAREIIGWVAVDNIVLECGSMPVEDILKVREESRVDNIQTDNPEVVQALQDSGCKVILRLNQAMKVQPSPDYLLLEKPIDLTTDLPVFRGYEVTADNLDEILGENQYSGIALKGSVEEKPGFKDYDELADILEALEIED